MFLARNNNVVMIMPEVRLSTVKLVLNFSVTGCLDLANQDMVDEVMSVLKSFGYCINVLVQSKCHQDSANVQSQKELVSKSAHTKSSESNKRVSQKLNTLGINEEAVRKKQGLKHKCLAKNTDSLAVKSPSDISGALETMLTGSKDYPSKAQCATINEDVPEIDLTLDGVNEREPDSTTLDAIEEVDTNMTDEYEEVDANLMSQMSDGNGNLCNDGDNGIEDKNSIVSMDVIDPLSIDQEFESTEVEAINTPARNGKSSVNDPEASRKHLWNKFACLLCNKFQSSYSQLTKHLSVVHYHEQLLEQWEHSSSACPICNKRVSSSKANKIIHVGIVHKRLFSVAHKSVQAHLKDLTLVAKVRSSKTSKWDQCRSHFLNKNTGWQCCKDFLDSPQDLLLHLGSAHCEDNLLSAYGPIEQPCQQCNVHPQYKAKDKKDLIKHVVSSHSHLLYRLMDVQDAYVIRECVENCYKCPICNLEYGFISGLKKHLSRSHYRSDILKQESFEPDCRVCQKLALKKSTGTLAAKTLWDIAQHLGLSHGHLDKVLPDSVKRALEQMEGCRKFQKHTES